MPILPKEVDIFPPDLLARDKPHLVTSAAGPAREMASAEVPDDDSDPGKWWVFYTLSRREKELSRRLLALSVPFYCPLIPRRNRSASGRVRTAHLPLFPGYVFSWASDEQRHQALTTNCISRTLRVTDEQSLQRDLAQVRHLIESNMPLAPESRIQPGAPVRVKSGPLAGIEGVVVKRHNGDRLLVSVHFLQQGASVSLDDFQVEPI